MKGDVAFAGFMFSAEEWRALDSETRAQLVSVAARRFPTGTEQPLAARGSIEPQRTFISGGTIVKEPQLAQGSGPLERDDYIDLFGDLDELKA